MRLFPARGRFPAGKGSSKWPVRPFYPRAAPSGDALNFSLWDDGIALLFLFLNQFSQIKPFPSTPDVSGNVRVGAGRETQFSGHLCAEE